MDLMYKTIYSYVIVCMLTSYLCYDGCNVHVYLRLSVLNANTEPSRLSLDRLCLEIIYLNTGQANQLSMTPLFTTECGMSYVFQHNPVSSVKHFRHL